MARIGENAFRQYRDGQDRLTAPEYMAEREVIRLAVNDLDDKVQRTESIREEFTNTVNEVETVKGEVVQTKQEVETRIGEFTQVIDQTTQELQSKASKQEVSQVSTQLENKASKTEVQEVSAQLAELENKVLYVERFRINGEKDDTELLRRAFKYIENAGVDSKYVLEFKSNTVYVISQPINFYEHKFTSFQGNRAVIKVADEIPLSSPIEYMIDMSRKGRQYSAGYAFFNGLTLDANGRALKCINAIDPNDTDHFGLSYQRFFHTEFVNIPKNGFGVYGVSWDVRFHLCTFRGYGIQSNPDEWRGTALYVARSANGVYVDNCNFSRLDRVAEGYGEKMVFSKNVIDVIKKAPFKMLGARGITIENNYFEACGGEDDEVEVFGVSGKSVVNALIILSGLKDSWNAISYGLVVEKNTFANSQGNNVLALNHAMNVTFRNNIFTFQSTKKNSIVYLYGVGINYYSYKSTHSLDIRQNSFERFYFDGNGNYQEKLFSKVVDTSGITAHTSLARYGAQDIVIKDSLNFDSKEFSLPSNLYKGNFEVTGAKFDVVKETIDNETVYKFTRTAKTPPNNLSLLQHLNKAKNSYLRLVLRTACTQSGAGLRLTINDGVKSGVYTSNKALSDGFETINTLFFVDPNATDLTLNINSYCNIGESVYIKDFLLIPAHYELGIYQSVE